MRMQPTETLQMPMITSIFILDRTKENQAIYPHLCSR
jgi:hypothetical protein